MLTFSLANAMWHETRPIFSSLCHPAFRQDTAALTALPSISDGGRPTRYETGQLKAMCTLTQLAATRRDYRYLIPLPSTSSGLFFLM